MSKAPVGGFTVLVGLFEVLSGLIIGFAIFMCAAGVALAVSEFHLFYVAISVFYGLLVVWEISYLTMLHTQTLKVLRSLFINVTAVLVNAVWVLMAYIFLWGLFQGGELISAKAGFWFLLVLITIIFLAKVPLLIYHAGLCVYRKTVLEELKKLEGKSIL